MGYTTEENTRKRIDGEKLRQAIEAEFGSTDSSVPPKKPETPKEKANTIAADRLKLRDALLAKTDAELFRCVTRLTFVVFAFIFLAWFECGAALGLILPAPISVNQNIFGFLIADLSLLLVSGALCFPELKNGASAFFTFRADSDSLAFVAFVGAAVTVAYLMAFPNDFMSGGVMIYSSCASAALMFALWSRTMNVRRRKNSILALSEASDAYSLKNIEINDGEEMPYPVADFLPDLDTPDDTPTPLDGAARVLAPAVFVCAIAALAINLVLGGTAYSGIASFSAICCFSSPVLFGFCASFSFLRTSRRLRKKEAFISGYSAVDALAGTSGAITEAGLVFPPETVAVHAIKPFGQTSVEKSVLDAASITAAVGGPLRQAFTGLIDQGGVRFENVEDIKYIDELGISARIGENEMLLGTRELMRTRAVQTPTREYEAKYAAQGRDILYLAGNGELRALFVVGYYSSKEIISSLKRLEHNGVSIYIRSNDPNVTPSMMAEKMGEDNNSVTILGGDGLKIMDTHACRVEDTGLAFAGSMSPYADALISCKKLRHEFGAFSVMRTIAAVLGIALVAYCLTVSGVKLLTPVAALEFQAIMSLPPLLISLIRKN
jgi:cation transport ATPase